MQHLNEQTEAKRWQGKHLGSLDALVLSLGSSSLSVSAILSKPVAKLMAKLVGEANLT